MSTGKVVTIAGVDYHATPDVHGTPGCQPCAFGSARGCELAKHADKVLASSCVKGVHHWIKVEASSEIEERLLNVGGIQFDKVLTPRLTCVDCAFSGAEWSCTLDVNTERDAGLDCMTWPYSIYKLHKENFGG